MSLQSITPTNDYMNYQKKYTLNGLICYYFNNRKIAKSKVPKEVLNNFLGDRETAFIEIEKRTKNKHYTGFTCFESHGKTLYYYNGERIPKRIIKTNEFEKIRNLTRIWEESYKEYYKKYKQPEEETNSNEPKEETPKVDAHLTPHELLQKYNINSKSDWKKWMLKNHPDKNPDTDIELVKLINMATDIIFG